ncbi:MAG: large conductance mechanosensitive channel protein MscL [Bacteroidia bacterium]|nr:large conductance mechanosensitive channel protein MscL [Bacteroidia bacterium]
MGFVKEFKTFALNGNVIDLAVGVIIGGAFGTLTNSVIHDLIMPLIGKVVGNADFSNLYIALSDNIPEGTTLVEAKKLGPVFAYGNFLTIVIDFLLLAFCIFLMVKTINRLKKKEEEAPAEPTATEVLLAEIRDELRNKKQA